MRYRKLSAPDASGLGGGDYTFGRSSAEIWRDVPEAPGQAVLTRLNLFTGEWFLDLAEGMPWGGFPLSSEVVRRGIVLGANAGGRAMMDLAVKTRVLDTPGVTAIRQFSSEFDADGRAARLRDYRVQMTLGTAYGQVEVTLSRNILTGLFTLGQSPLGGGSVSLG